MSRIYTPSGTHVLLDLYGCSALSDCSFIEDTLREAATICGATILHGNFHSFGVNKGVTGVLLLAESHISIHTWPESQYAAVDIFMCGQCDPSLAISPIKTRLNAEKAKIKTVVRNTQVVTRLNE